MPVVSKASGDDTTKLLHSDSGFSPARAMETGRLLDDNGISHCEEPRPYWELEQTKLVADTLAIDVTGGEQDSDFPPGSD